MNYLRYLNGLTGVVEPIRQLMVVATLGVLLVYGPLHSQKGVRPWTGEANIERKVNSPNITPRGLSFSDDYMLRESKIEFSSGPKHEALLDKGLGRND